MEDNNNENLQSFIELQAGTTLNNGKYIIEKKIGAGGFGITYKAIQSGLKRTVCIKEYFLSGRCGRNSQSKTVFLQDIPEEIYEKYRIAFVKEAQILASLKHPNIVDIIDIFDENNTSYMVMPYIEGTSLQKIIEKNGKLQYADAINYIAQITNAIDIIHKQNIYHRDIKPDNIMITSDYKAILIDFGNARQWEPNQPKALTAIFTRGYAPPEQYSSKAEEGSYTDIYALGATLYFVLTGVEPIDSASRSIDVLAEPIGHNPNIPSEVNRTIMKAMELKPENRHQTIQEFMDDMLNIKPSVVKEKPEVTTSGTPIQTVTKKKRPKWLVILLLLSFAFIAWFSYIAYDTHDAYTFYLNEGDNYLSNKDFENARVYYEICLDFEEWYPLLYELGLFNEDVQNRLKFLSEEEEAEIERERLEQEKKEFEAEKIQMEKERHKLDLINEQTLIEKTFQRTTEYSEYRTIILTESDLSYNQQSWNYTGNGNPLKTDWIKSNWDEGKRITSAKYTSHGWFLVMANNTGIGMQSYHYDTYWPKDWIKTKWDDGYHITCISKSDTHWFVVMSQGEGYTTQSYWSANGSDLDDWLSKKRDDGYFITSMEYDNGNWRVVMSKGGKYSAQSWLVVNSIDELYEIIYEIWDKGYKVHQIEYGNSYGYFVTYGIYANNENRSQNFIMDPEDVKGFIKDRWDASHDISHIGG